MDKLTKDTFFLVARFLSTKDVLNCSETCQHLNKELWRILLHRDSQNWMPVAPRYEYHQGLIDAKSFKSMYKIFAKKFKRRCYNYLTHSYEYTRIKLYKSIDCKKGNVFEIVQTDTTYSTVKWLKPIEKGIHYIECIFQNNYNKRYFGMGCMNYEAKLPERGRGIWLEIETMMYVPPNNTIWIDGSVTYNFAHNRVGQKDDRIGCLINMDKRLIYFCYNNNYTMGIEINLGIDKLCFAFCFAGTMQITQTFLPEILPF